MTFPGAPRASCEQVSLDSFTRVYRLFSDGSLQEVCLLQALPSGVTGGHGYAWSYANSPSFQHHLLFPAPNISGKRKGVHSLLLGASEAGRHVTAVLHELQGDQVNAWRRWGLPSEPESAH